MIRQKYNLRLCEPNAYKNKNKTIENIWDNRMINTRRSCDGRKWSWKCAMLNVDDRTLPHNTPQVIARLPAAYDRHFCDHLRSTEDMCRINCVHRTDVVRLVAISGISVVNWSHKCDQKYSSYEFSAFTCVNLSQPSVTYRNPSVTNALRVGHTKSYDRLRMVATGYRKWTQVNVSERSRQTYDICAINYRVIAHLCEWT